MYDPEKGDPKQGIPPGTPFEKLPQTWQCPECKIYITKHGLFKRLEQQQKVHNKKLEKSNFYFLWNSVILNLWSEY
jgi:rubredoxin